MKVPAFKKTLIAFLSLIALGSWNALGAKDKELYLPTDIWKIPAGNNYDSEDSDYSYSRMVESDNFAIFWHRDFGDDPMDNPNEAKRFNTKDVLDECERLYNCYVNDLKMVERGRSLADQYKILIFVFSGNEGTAFGGGAADQIGVFWTPAERIHQAPFGALAHELGHSFQYLSRADTGAGAAGPINEMGAQFMLWQSNPDWVEFERYHMEAYLKQTHLAFLHPENMYHAPFVLEYWSQKHGRDFYGKLHRATRDGEDPVETYQRLNDLDQDDFNDEMFDAACHFVTWDLERVEEICEPFANRHITHMEEADDGWIRVTASSCPQNYGYNAIKLDVPRSGATVKLIFEGIAGADGYNAVQVDSAGWRYGFVASLSNGERVYGDIGKKADGKVKFKAPRNTEALWFVVSGAPTKHWHVGSQDEEEQWPYQIALQGADVDDSCLE